ncbi:MAG: cytochrome c oxidase subunit 3 family protein [Candidatus Omnitrophota bacterium]|nr:MAG: cytochrome c oxidase subunit 3 family protein [Candidatus Omnitrophota bacterium]
MWLFLVTEIVLFGGLFCAYAVYRANHPEIFVYAHKYLDVSLGALNTAVLIFSSLTMALAVRSAQLNQQKALIRFLAVTILCGFVFLAVKAVEYEHKWKHGLLWGVHYNPEKHNTESHDIGHEAKSLPDHANESSPMLPTENLHNPIPTTNEKSAIAPAADAPRGLASRFDPDLYEHIRDVPKNVQIFFGIYFVMTGLHALHVIIGMGLIGWILRRSIQGHFSAAYFTPVDLTGLYWHLVDLIWIYLFPLLYLIH